MTPIVLTIPDEVDELPAWLERQLVGPDLARLVAELEAVHGPTDDTVSIGDVLGRHREAVLTAGLASLPREALKTLLRQPRRLLDLQELALLDGGDYWIRLAGSAVSPPRSEPAARGRRTWMALALLAATAATVALVFLVSERPGPRGWQRESVFAPDRLNAADYLNRLADAVEEHRAAPPQNADQLARRIGEIRDGCTRFAMARHEPLTDAERNDVKARCRRWSDRLDDLRKQLEDNPADAPRIRDEVDAVVEQMARVLRTKASSSGA